MGWKLFLLLLFSVERKFSVQIVIEQFSLTRSDCLASTPLSLSVGVRVCTRVSVCAWVRVSMSLSRKKQNNFFRESSKHLKEIENCVIEGNGLMTVNRC